MYFRLMNSKKRILVAPLNWGLGHATRCIPIINVLLQHNFNVIISANGRSFHLLKDEFPDLKFVKRINVVKKFLYRRLKRRIILKWHA